MEPSEFERRTNIPDFVRDMIAHGMAVWYQLLVRFKGYEEMEPWYISEEERQRLWRIFSGNAATNIAAPNFVAFDTLDRREVVVNTPRIAWCQIVFDISALPEVVERAMRQALLRSYEERGLQPPKDMAERHG